MGDDPGFRDAPPWTVQPLDGTGGRSGAERRRVGAFVAASTVMLLSALLMRMSVAPPYAPRVHVRWVHSLSDGQRSALERELSLVAGSRREGSTWEYDLVDPSVRAVVALIKHEAVEDTHFINRANGQITADAPLGTTLLPDREAAGWIHSHLFDWFISYWIAALFVSVVWFAAAPRFEGRIQSSK